MPAFAKGPKVAFLWGHPQDNQLNGTLVKLPAEFTGRIKSRGPTFRAAVIKGQPQYRVLEADVKILEPGSYFSTTGKSALQVSCDAGEDCFIYVRMEGKFDVIPVLPKPASGKVLRQR